MDGTGELLAVGGAAEAVGRAEGTSGATAGTADEDGAPPFVERSQAAAGANMAPASSAAWVARMPCIGGPRTTSGLSEARWREQGRPGTLAGPNGTASTLPTVGGLAHPHLGRPRGGPGRGVAMSSERRSRALAVGAVGFGVLLVSTLAILSASRELAPSFDEVARLDAIERAQSLVRDVAARGVTRLGAPEAKRGYAGFDAHGTVPVLLGAWSSLSIGRAQLLDPLSAARLPWLLFGALGPLGVYWLVRPSRGVFTAVIAAVLLAVSAPWIHGAAVMKDVAVSVTWSLLVLVAYTRSLGPARLAARARSRTACWAVASSLALGIGLSMSLATLWVVPLVAVHHLVARPRSLRRTLRAGRVPAPPALLLMLVVSPVVMLVANPARWGASPPAIARWFLSPLRAPDADAPPAHAAGAYAVEWFVRSTPIAVLVLVAAGVLFAMRDSLSRRFATGGERARRDRHGLAALAMLGLAGALLGPLLAPEVLRVAPPRVEAAVPFAVVLAALGLERLSQLAGGARRRHLLVATVLVGVAWLGLRAPATGAAAYSPWLGGARGAVRGDRLLVRDGSELGLVLARLAAARGPTVSVHAPAVPPSYWSNARVRGLLRKEVRVERLRERAGYVLDDGGGSERPLAVVRRDGATLWALVAR